MRSDITNVRKDSRQRGPVREAYIFAAVAQFKGTESKLRLMSAIHPKRTLQKPLSYNAAFVLHTGG